VVQQIQNELMKQDAINQQIMSYGTSAKAVYIAVSGYELKVNGNILRYITNSGDA